MIRVQREVVVRYVADLSWQEASDLILDNSDCVKLDDLTGLSDAELAERLVAVANREDSVGDSLDDASYEVDSGSQPWEVA